MKQDEEISVVCFYWDDGFRDYRPEHVNILAENVRQCFSIPHRFVCVCDDANIEGFSDQVEVVELPNYAKWTAKLKSPMSRRFPSSYRRLWAFSLDARCLGDRILMLDIDCIIRKDLLPLFEYSNADFVGWAPRHKGKKKKGIPERLGGGTWLLRTGTHAWLWDNFSVEGVRKAKRAGWKGSDQAWISYNLAGECVTWPKEMGIYKMQDFREWDELPKDARIVHFNSGGKPWHMKSFSHLPWYRKLIQETELCYE